MPEIPPYNPDSLYNSPFPSTSSRPIEQRVAAVILGGELLVQERDRLTRTHPRIEFPFFTPLEGDKCVVYLRQFVGQVNRSFHGRRVEKFRFHIKFLTGRLMVTLMIFILGM